MLRSIASESLGQGTLLASDRGELGSGLRPSPHLPPPLVREVPAGQLLLDWPRERHACFSCTFMARGQKKRRPSQYQGRFPNLASERVEVSRGRNRSAVQPSQCLRGCVARTVHRLVRPGLRALQAPEPHRTYDMMACATPRHSSSSTSTWNYLAQLTDVFFSLHITLPQSSHLQSLHVRTSVLITRHFASPRS
jgi:hypothetical protein